MSKKIRVVKHYSGVNSGVGADSQPVLSKSVCAAMLAGAMVLGGGVFVSSPAYADGYVDGTGNNIYYGYKTDASYTEARFHIEVDYYDTLEHAQAGKDEGKDPLGKFVRVHYLSNCAKKDGAADDWRFRPMWWYGVPKGLKNVQNITYTRVEKLTNQRGNQPFVPTGSSQFTFTDTNGYGVVSKKTYPTPKQWKSISNFYFDEQNVLASKGWKQLLGLNGGSYDNAGNTEDQWGDYKDQTAGLQGIFVDWESAGQRFYDMTYVGEMTDDAWQKRDENPLRFAAGVYRFAGNWHYAVGQKHNTPKIADHLKLNYPEVTKVKKLDALSNKEKGKVKTAIEDANRGKAGTQTLFDELVKDGQDGIVINNDGSATITFKDNTKRIMPASLLVTKDETDKDKYKPVMPERTPVVNLKNLTSDEKTKIRQAIIDANGGSSPNEFLKHVKQTNNQYDFKVNEDGSVEVTYEDDSKLTIPAEDLVFQGPKISDWAPYVVPDAIEIENLTKLSDTEVSNIVSAFDTANTGITPYDEAKTKNSNKAPVTVDSKTGDATIKWADGSTTTIAAWQFLKQKPKTPTPNPQPPTPTPAAEKEFIVEAPTTQTRVKFDPFNMKETDLTTYSQALDANKNALKKVKGKDAKDNSDVTITDVSYSVKDGKGYITFKADKYKDATYPMSVFFKKDPGTQTPQTPSTETKTETDNDNPKNTFTYKVTKTETEGDTPTAQEAVKALKQFVKDNYDNVSDSDLQNVTSDVAVGANWKPKANTKNMGPYGGTNNNAGPMLTISLGLDNGIKVSGHPWLDDDDPDWDPGTIMDLITIKPDELYTKRGGAQQQDNTIDNLKKQAKDLLDKRRNTDKLTNDDLKRAGISDPDQLNNDKIDGMSEKDLRDLIRKLTDAKKAERKYNPIPEIEVTDPENLSEDDFKKAAEAFLKANYDGTGSLTGDKAPYTVPTSLKPKTDTVLMEPASDTNATGISSITYANSDFKTLIFKDKNNNQLFTVSVKYKKKAGTPAPSPDALAQMKKDAEKQIDRNPNLTKEQKEEYKKQIGDATTADKIKEILKNAADKGKENANSSDPNTQQTINNNKGGGDAKKDAEKKQKEKEDKKQEEQKNQELQDKKKKASDAIDGLGNLTQDEKDKLKENLNGKSGDTTKPGAKTPEEVQQIVNEAQARNAAHKAIKDELPFLDHGTGAEGKTDTTHADDAALNELLGTKSGKDQTLTDLETALAKTNPAATAEEIKNALDTAKRQNAINEQNAKNAGIAKLDALLQQLTDAENGLNEAQKAAVKDKVEAAKTAINGAKDTVNKATKPSDIKTAVDGVSIKDAMDAINTQVTNAQKDNNTKQENENKDALANEKKEQIERIKNSDLPDAEKKKAIDDINNAKKLGDPTGIADRALKAKKIADALKKIDEFKHLNKAQKDAFKAIINGTDAGNHKDDNGKDTGVDDIDDALANAANTDNAMARLEELKVIADKFAKGEKYKNGDSAKKTAFDNASTAAGAVLDKAKGDPKDADQVNELYKDLLKAMQDLDNTVKGAGVKTDALAAEIDSDKNLKPSETDPKTPGDSVYNTSSKEKKEAFDKALKDAEAALQTANSDNEDAKKPTSTPLTPDQEAQKQKAVDEALDKLIKARLALDGVNTKPLQDEIDKDNKVKNSDKYTYSIKDKKTAFDTALSEANELIKKLTGAADQQAQPGQGTQQPDLSTKEAKQKALDAALKKLQDAAKALDGTKPIEPTPNPNPTPTPTPTPSPLPTPGAGTDNPGSGNAGSGSEAGYGVNDNAPTIVDKGELNIQIDSAETDSKPGNAGAGNAGNANAGSATGAQGGAGTSSGSGMGTGTAGAANAGVDNKAVNNAVENAPEVKQADAAVKQAAATLDEALAQAKRVAADPHATQAQVDAAAVKLADARKALADAQDNAAKVRAAVRSRVIKGMRSRGNAGVAAGADVATAGLMATMIAAIGGAFVTRRMRAMHANRD
ncbi:GA module-containing protein [Gardnerella vaginalis]|uniref:GA module-containing protein n=1 Tax=Gardnerella vaginalis TaxID=2702 RepID=UPI0009436A70|nr:GA module-containing protein [Gardnerella vaginalis]OKY55493.1 Extracellular matrix-binding protein ebh precursor [Gardnerella vaginalis]